MLSSAAMLRSTPKTPDLNWRDDRTRERFAALGLCEFSDLVAAPDLVLVKDAVGWKRVYSGSFADGEPFFLKVIDPLPPRERRRARLRRRGDRSPLGREERALRHLESHELPAPRVLAFAEEGNWQGVRRAVLATTALPPGSSLEDAVMREGLAGDWQRARRIAEDLGVILGRMHASGLNHRDFYAGHLRLDEDDALWMLDFDRAEIRSRVPRRRRVKDLAALDVSLPARLVAPELRRRLLMAYLRTSSVDRPAGFVAAVLRKSATIRRHLARKIARGDANVHLNE